MAASRAAVMVSVSGLLAAAPTLANPPRGCAKLEKAAQKRPNATNLASVAKCHAHDGKTATAWAELARASEQAKREHNTRIFRNVRKETKLLEGKLAHLTIAVAGEQSSELTVTRNDKPIATDQLGVALVVDPGSYDIAASASSYAPWSSTVTISAGKSETVTIPALVPVDAKPAIAAAIPDESGAPSVHDEPAPAPSASQHPIGLTPDVMTGIGFYQGSPSGSGHAVVVMLATTYDVSPRLHVFARFGAIRDSQPTGQSAFAFSNPNVGALYVRDLGGGVFGGASATAIPPLGQNGGDSPDLAVASAEDQGKIIDDGGTFDPNYFAAYPGVVLGIRRGRLNASTTNQLKCSFRMRGDRASVDATKILEVAKAHVGYEVISNLELYGDGLYAHYVNTPSFVVQDPTSAVVMVAGGGVAWHAGALRLLGELDIAFGNNPFGREGMHIVTLDLAIAR